MANEIELGEYLFQRLAQLGLGSVHGVPGDYNLTLLDYISPSGLHWVGNANELCSGYAADGYARIKGLGALTTSFGVGELSAINAVAGAYSERVPVVHIVGTPTIAAQKAGACLHHSLGDGNLRVFSEMSKLITVAQANLVDAATAPQSIDEVLKKCILYSRPVYIEIPTDMVKVKVKAPMAPIDLALSTYDEKLEDDLVEVILARMKSSKQPLIIVDGFTARFNIKDEINALVKATGYPTLTTPFGKSIVNESLPNFHGVYYGAAGEPECSQWVGNCDLVLAFGVLKSDINSFGFTTTTDASITITFDKHSICMGNLQNASSGPLVSIKSAIKKLLVRLQRQRLFGKSGFPDTKTLPRYLLEHLPNVTDSDTVDQYSFWLTMSKFFRPEDILITETGTASYGGQSIFLPVGTTVINSSIWLSIGYALSACQGVALAQRERRGSGKPSGRTILFEGDGSLQMTAQAISDLIRNRLDVIIFVLNNNGYTIERLIHGFDESYNDVQPWRNLEAPTYFGAPRDDPLYPVKAIRATNWGELRSILDGEVQIGKGLNIVEVMMNVDDAPVSLRRFASYLEKRNSGKE